MAQKKGGLGRGLDSLFSDNSTENDSAVSVKINDVEPNRKQPRKDFDEEALSQLAESISQHGLIQPIVVRPNPDGNYTIIAGERRWRACRIAGLETVPVIVKDVTDKEVMELALVENLQREDLNPVEEAFGYKALMEEYGLTQENVAERVGKSRSAVANALRLLSLRDEEIEALKGGLITPGHARALLSIDDAEQRQAAYRLSLAGRPVREIEALSRASKAKPKTRKLSKNTYFKEVELALKEELGRKTVVKPVGSEGGTITLEFYNKEDLEEIVKRLTSREQL